MKYLSILFLIVFLSCSKNDDQSSNSAMPPQLKAHTWVFDSIYSTSTQPPHTGTATPNDGMYDTFTDSVWTHKANATTIQMYSVKFEAPNKIYWGDIGTNRWVSKPVIIESLNDKSLIFTLYITNTDGSFYYNRYYSHAQ